MIRWKVYMYKNLKDWAMNIAHSTKMRYFQPMQDKKIKKPKEDDENPNPR